MSVILFVACGPEMPRTAEVVARDSAGVTIVENVVDWDEAPRWHVSDEPQVQIGTVSGDRDFEFASIAGVGRLLNGQFVVLDRQAREVRYFDSDGEHLISAGGSGAGPGEFGNPEGPWILEGDTVAVWDTDHGRFTLLGADGQYLTTLVVQEPIQPLGFVGHRIVASERSMARVRPGDSEGLLTDQKVLQLIELPGGPLTEVAIIEGLEFFRYSNGRNFGLTPVPYTVDPAAAAASGRLVVTVGPYQEIRTFDPQGQLRRIVRWDDDPQPLLASEFQSEVTRRLAAADPESRAEIERRHEGMTAPASIPAYQRVVLGSTGEIWLEHFTHDYGGWPPIRRRASRWTVLSEDGRLVGALELPVGFVLHQVTAEGLLGVYRDALDVQYLWFLALEK